MSNLDVRSDGKGVTTIWLDRGDKHNALSADLIAELSAAAVSLGADPGVRVIVLAGRGKSFCAGGDLGWMRAQMDADRPAREAAARALAELLGALNRLPKPLIGRVHGNAFGGGVGLCCVCDTVVAAEGARFGLTETRLGLIPATIGPYVLARLGEGPARRVFMSSRILGAQEAASLGIVSSVVPEAELDAAVAREVTPYLACAPQAVAAAKAYARSFGTPIDDATVARSVAALIAQWESGEAEEGIAAFFEKRKPRWASS